MGSASQAPGSVGSAGTASRANTRLAIYNPAKIMPLMATTRGGAGGGRFSVGVVLMAILHSAERANRASPRRAVLQLPFNKDFQLACPHGLHEHVMIISHHDGETG